MLCFFIIFPYLHALQVCTSLLIQFLHFRNNQLSTSNKISAEFKFSSRAGTAIGCIFYRAASKNSCGLFFFFVLWPLQQQCIKAVFGKAA